MKCAVVVVVVVVVAAASCTTTAPQPSAAPPAVWSPTPAQSDMKKFRADVYASVKAELHTPIDALKQPHKMSPDHTDKCLVTIIFDATGTPTDVFLLRSSGDEVLDDECLRSCRSAHYPPPPASLTPPVKVTQPITFHL